MDLLLTFLNYSALVAAGLACARSFKEAQQIKKVKNSILNSQQYLLNTQYHDNLDKAREGEQMVYMEIAPKKSTLSPTTFIKRMQSVPAAHIYPQGSDLMQGEAGNSFEYKLNYYQKIRVEINECNIDERALDRSIKPIKLHPSAQTTHCDITYTLKTAINLAFIGSLKFNLEANEFILQPLFLLPLKSKQNCFSLISKYYNDKLSFLRIKQIFLYISIGFLFVMAYYRKEAYLKKQKRMQEVGKEQFKRVQTRARDQLKCACGKNMNLIGDCGHLSMCSGCYQNDKTCKICGKPINIPQIIYI